MFSLDSDRLVFLANAGNNNLFLCTRNRPTCWTVPSRGLCPGSGLNRATSDRRFCTMLVKRALQKGHRVSIWLQCTMQGKQNLRRGWRLHQWQHQQQPCTSHSDARAGICAGGSGIMCVQELDTVPNRPARGCH